MHKLLRLLQICKHLNHNRSSLTCDPRSLFASTPQRVAADANTLTSQSQKALNQTLAFRN
jgi:hypothetical protein